MIAEMLESVSELETISCSECDNTTEDKEGWTQIGFRWVCAKCREKYNTGGNGGQYYVPSKPLRIRK